METDSFLAEVVSLSRRHHPYNNARQFTIGRTKNQYFEGALPESGGLDRAVIRLHQTASHANQEALPPTDPGERANLTEHNQRDFRSVTVAKETITIIRTRYNTDRATCVHTSWWQTGPISLQLALLDKRPLGTRDSSRVPLTLESLASLQHGTTHAVKRGPVASLKGRGEKFSRKRSCGACQRESSSPNKPPFCGAQKQRWVAFDNRPEKTKSISQSTPFQNGGAIHATKCSTPRLLHGQGGFEGCLSNNFGVSRVSLSLGLSK